MIYLENTYLQMKAERIEEYALTVINSNKELKKLYDSLKEKDKEVYEHSRNVCRIAVVLGLAYNFNLDDLITMAVGSLLHDIGKIYLDKNILYKPERLSENEKILVEAHTLLGYKMIKDLDLNPMVANIIKFHHEKLNNMGYPDNLHNAEISIYIQIVTIADIYDALISERVYKKAIPEDKAFEILESDEDLNQVAIGILKEILSRYEVTDNK